MYIIFVYNNMVCVCVCTTGINKYPACFYDYDSTGAYLNSQVDHNVPSTYNSIIIKIK